MKSFPLCLALVLPLLTQCASVKKQAAPPVAAASAEKSAPAAPLATDAAENADVDDLDEYAIVEIKDPLERINRGTFWLNDKMYMVLFRPLSKGYEKVIPKPLRNGVNNAYENAKYPVRLVNALLQGKLKRAGQHTGKFLVNTVAGLGGLIRATDKIPELADLPDDDTGKTFAVWGIGHGAYIVIPFLGPSSVRDGIGLVGDYALNPVNWPYFHIGHKADWTRIPPAGNTLRALPSQLSTYEETKRDAIDPYIAIRSAYAQYRAEFVKK